MHTLLFVCMYFPCRRSGHSCADWLWRIIMGLGVSQLPRWDDNHSGCPLISTGIGASIKLETLRDERGHCCEREHVCVMFSPDQALHVVLTCGCFVWISCQVERGRKKRRNVLFFFRLASRWVNLCFMEIKYGLHPPSLPPDGPCGERVIIWPIWAREPESVDVGWAVRCHAKPPVPRSLNTIPFTCPLSLVLSLPPPPHHRLDLLQLPPSSSSSPPPSPPWDRLSSTWQGLAWITGIPGQVSLLREVSSACMCLYASTWGREGERERKREKEREKERVVCDA